jgi:protein-S-isoprenylcysteine O-methyltransferase Ste14
MTGVDLQRVQQKRKRVLTVGIVAILAVFALSDSAWRVDWPRTDRAIQWSGLGLIFMCLLGRTWTALYIAGQKRRALVTTGPYSIVRNPLYLFTLLGAAGVGMASSSLVMTAICSAFAAAVFLSVVRREEQFLLATFPREFPQYIARVPRLLPRFSTWQDAEQLIVQPRLVCRTFLDATLLLMVVPLLGLRSLARDLQWLPALFHLP